MIWVIRVRKPGETETSIEEIMAKDWFDATYILQLKCPGVQIVTFVGVYQSGKEVQA